MKLNQEDLNYLFNKYYSNRVNLGETNYIHRNGMHCNKHYVKGIQIIVRLCSPEHKGDKPSFYWSYNAVPDVYYIHKATGQTYNLSEYEPNTSQVYLTWQDKDICISIFELEDNYIKAKKVI